MAKINWTEEAERWLQDIYSYIAQDNPEAARRVIQNLYDKTQALSEFPELGHRYHRIPNQHIRILVQGHYRIAYLIKASGEIDVLGVFHGALDIDRYLF